MAHVLEAMGQHGQRKAEKKPCLVKVYFQEGYTCKSKYIQMVGKNKAPFMKKPNMVILLWWLMLLNFKIKWLTCQISFWDVCWYDSLNVGCLNQQIGIRASNLSLYLSLHIILYTHEVQADQSLPTGRLGNPWSMDHPEDSFFVWSWTSRCSLCIWNINTIKNRWCHFISSFFKFRTCQSCRHGTPPSSWMSPSKRWISSVDAERWCLVVGCPWGLS